MKSPLYIDVALNVPLNQTFTYKVPEGTDVQAPFGRRVAVRFGSRSTYGFVTASYDALPPDCAVGEEKIRRAAKYSDDVPLLTRELFDIARFMSEYYIASIGECIFTMIPQGKRETGAPSFSFAEDESSYERKALSEEQIKASRDILSDRARFHYLYGPTGSGKTEVFLKTAESVLSEGRGVIYLVPEIGLTPQVLRAVRSRFGDTVAALHSSLTPSQRLGEWKRILSGEARIVVGARSAVFAPVQNLGLVIIDEEHDSSYKSGSSPRYHARQIAMMRCKRLGIPLLMGSATPSVEAWHSMQSGVIVRHTLARRISGGDLPKIDCVDLGREPKSTSSLSRALREELRATLDEKKQAILFLNRRGFTHFFRCMTCGFELKCKNCSVSLTYHKSENRLRCHYCGYSIPPPSQCPRCGSFDIGYAGFGTEYIEREVRAAFPDARVIRVDTDSLKRRDELQARLDEFRRGDYDIMLGTQMIAKGLNFPNLKLVGVVLADTSLHLPDFRAAERTFSLITQVAGRAGRFFPGGRVIVQTYMPDESAVRCAVEGRIESFYKQEQEVRKMLNFPPYSRLVRLVFRSKERVACVRAAADAQKMLSKALEGEDAEVLGPSECPLERVSGNHRQQILLRAPHLAPLLKAARHLLQDFTSPRDVYIESDTDPQNLL